MKKLYIGIFLFALSMGLAACENDGEFDSQESSTVWVDKNYAEIAEIMPRALEQYVETESTDCYLKKHVENDYLNEDIAIYFNSSCDAEHQRGLYVNGEFFEYQPFLEDLDATTFEASLYELISPRNQQYLLVFNGYNAETYAVLLEGSATKGQAWRWTVQKFHAPEGGSFADISGDYNNHWTDYGGEEDTLWGRYDSDRYGFNTINSEEVRRAQEAHFEELNEGYPMEELVWDGTLLNLKKYCEDYTGCDYFYEDESGLILNFPEELAGYLGYRSNFSGGRGTGTYSVSPDETNFFYLASDFSIRRYNWQTQKEETFMSIYTDTDGISDFVWSPSGQKVAFVVTNMTRAEEYPLWNKIFVLEFNEEGLFLEKQKYDVDVFSSCHSGGCNADSSSFSFVDENTLTYESYNREAYCQDGEELETFWLKLTLQ